MLHRRKPVVLLGMVLVLMSLFGSPGFAQERDPDGFPAEGWLEAAFSGEQCQFTQTYERHGKHFLSPTMQHMKSSKVRTITFTDPACMEADPIVQNDFEARLNKEALAKVIADWHTKAYYLADTRHDVKQRRQPGFLQGRGECMVDPKYPYNAIAIEFVREPQRHYTGDPCSHGGLW